MTRDAPGGVIRASQSACPRLDSRGGGVKGYTLERTPGGAADKVGGVSHDAAPARNSSKLVLWRFSKVIHSAGGGVQRASLSLPRYHRHS